MSLPRCPRGCANEYEASDGRTGTRVIGHEVPGLYDGIAYWSCPTCGTSWHRFGPPGRVHAWVQANVPDIQEAAS